MALGRRGKNLIILLVLLSLMIAATVGLWLILDSAKRDIGSGDYRGLEATEESDADGEIQHGGLRRRATADEDRDGASIGPGPSIDPVVGFDQGGAVVSLEGTRSIRS
ncbi:hypothetical protein [Engelhardtia mirabilis]|uniref:Uncharacterized protein n=1 Tax=Engelhardtia mirabilis TaxID=2528011 RepID=A0A518BLV0_9BACT|nr:hypothetical protein Pla133_30320 [Planctomycetes bacterium Pla133]QDV02267.1 hypothetical protein Pla86_30310 [Planctomycetes bacterium Pla86]